MAVDFSATPYNDDFQEDKNFHKILFKPGLAVQTRELNQLQSNLKNQIERFGQHVFVEGSTVLNLQKFFDNNLVSVAHVGNIDTANIIGTILTGDVSGTIGLVKAYNLSTKKLILSITSGSEFITGETLSYVTDNVTTTILSDINTPAGTALLFSVNSGIMFAKGSFVYVDNQSIILNDSDNTSTHSVGFKITESVISSEEDDSLLDNSQGSPNFAAPGADRYFINMELVSRELGTTEEDYIELARIEVGQLAFVQQRTLYAELEKEFARRTNDESGNYTVRPFELSFEDHKSTAVVKPVVQSGIITGFTIINDGGEYLSAPSVQIIGDGSGAEATAVLENNKLIGFSLVSGGSGYSLEETSVRVSGDPDKFSAKLEPGKAYVLGYEFETQSPTYVTMNKSRATNFADNIDIPTFYGNFLYTKNMFGVFDTDSYSTVELHSVSRSSVSGATTKLGTARVRFLDYVSGTVGTSAVYKMYLFDIITDSGKLFSDTESIVIRSGATVLAGTDIDDLSKIDGIPSSDTFLSGTDRTSLLFPLNHIYTKTLRDATDVPQNDYTFKRVYPAVTFNSGSGSIATLNGLERFVGGTGSYSLSNIVANYHFVVTSSGTSTYSVGEVITPISATGGVISPGSAQTLTFDFGVATGFNATVIASVNANAQTEKTKSLQPYRAVVISSPSTSVGGKDSLGYSDIYKMASVYNTGTADPTGLFTLNTVTGEIDFSITANNVTSNYNLDNGQRDDMYDHGAIELIGAAPGVTDYIVVVFNYFTHTNNGFASVDSYTVPYEDIPFFTSPTTGVTISLADVVDFRPRRADLGNTLTNGQLPDPDLQFQADYSYYVGRIDRIVATSAKQFAIKEGIPSTTPKVPSEEQNGMTLYVVEIPPYTQSLSDISVKYVENKRYTMRDIGRIEKRVENLEYYTQLSLLEKQAKDESIVDSTNFEKFKNGFFVDSFTSNDALENSGDPEAWSRQIWGWWNNRDSAVLSWNKGASRVFSSSVADSLNTDYKIAMDPINALLRAEALTSYGTFSFQTGTGVRRSANTVTLDFTEKAFISNNVASKAVNINPFDVIAFNGSINLTPSSDMWVETKTLPAVNKVVDVQLPDLPAISNTIITDRSSIQLLFRETGRVSRTETRVVGQQTSSLGSSVVDMQYLPFARPRSIIGVGSKFKPKARLYPFFEDIPFASNTKPMTLVETSGNVGLFNGIIQEEVQFRTGSIAGPIVATAKVAIYSPPKTDDLDKRLLSIFDVVGTIPTPSVSTSVFVTAGSVGTKYASITSIVSYVYGAPLLPDEHGLLGFEFNIPENTIRTGIRTLKLVDNIDNQQQGSQSTGITSYFAQGILQSKQETLLTTRSIQNQRVTTVTGVLYDPLAQTFNVDGRFNPAGIHVSSIDVFFKSKAKTIPVSLEITRTVNGYPESAITSIPFAVTDKSPDDIVVSEDGTLPTKFNLPDLVHLVPGEYAVVLKANTQEYEVFVGEMGRTDLITNQIIAKQPLIGVFFKSQNASTWTAYQEEDLKFNLNIANFNSTGVAKFVVDDIDEFNYSTMNIRTSDAIPTGTKVDFKYKSINGGTLIDLENAESIPVTTNVDIPLGFMNKVNGEGSYVIEATMTTDNPSVSPVIDIEGLGVILVNNRINNTDISVFDNEEVATGGDVEARYMSKPVVLADGFDSTNLVVTLDAYIPNGTEVRVYSKTSPTESTAPFQDNVWKRMELSNQVGSSQNEFDFKELKFYPEGAFGNFGVPIDSPMESFNVFAVKIVLVSNNNAVTPFVRDLRAIALAN